VSQPYLSPHSRKQRTEVTFRHDQFSISNLMTAMSQPSWKNYPQPVALQTLSTVRALRWVESSSVNGRTKAVRNCTPAADTLGAFRESDGIHIKEIRSNNFHRRLAAAAVVLRSILPVEIPRKVIRVLPSRGGSRPTTCCRYGGAVSRTDPSLRAAPRRACTSAGVMRNGAVLWLTTMVRLTYLTIYG
jgi:hypothetical protein